MAIVTINLRDLCTSTRKVEIVKVSEKKKLEDILRQQFWTINNYYLCYQSESAATVVNVTPEE